MAEKIQDLVSSDTETLKWWNDPLVHDSDRLWMHALLKFRSENSFLEHYRPQYFRLPFFSAFCRVLIGVELIYKSLV